MVYKAIKITDIKDKDYERIYAALHSTRKEHIDKLKSENQRLCSLAGEFLAKKILKKHFNIACPVIKRDENGKPFTDSEVFISISHCGDTVVCAADSKSIGIDIEKIKPVSDKLIKRVCTKRELEYVFDPCQMQDKLYRFFEVWTAKEAYFKKQGTGITDFQSVDILSLNRQIINYEDCIIQIIK